MNKELKALERAKMEHSIIKQGFPEQEYIKSLNEIETTLEDYADIEKMCKQYNIEFNLVNIRHALFTLAQLKGSSGTNWENYNRKLKALEIIKETPVFAYYITIYKNAYEMVSDVKGFRVNNSVEELQEMFDLLKEVLL